MRYTSMRGNLFPEVMLIEAMLIDVMLNEVMQNDPTVNGRRPTSCSFGSRDSFRRAWTAWTAPSLPRGSHTCRALLRLAESMRNTDRCLPPRWHSAANWDETETDECPSLHLQYRRRRGSRPCP